MKNKIHRVSLGLLALMTLGGCASFNDCYYEKSQKVRAFKEYVHCGRPECSEYPRDYKKGWLDGFYEVATGGSDCPPSVAPARYYEPKAILKYHDKKRHDYYSGWQDGAARASQFPDTHYLRIYETEACPFPRCESPCTDGSCGSCGESFVGMSAAKEMIEAAPTPATPVAPATAAPTNYAAAPDVSPSAKQGDEASQETVVQLTTPEGEEVGRSSETADPAAPPSLPPQGLPTPPTPPGSMLADLPTLPMIPPPPAPQSAELAAAETVETPSAAATEDASDTPLVSIPGYRTTTQWTRPAARPITAQPAGFVRMVEPFKDVQPKRASTEGVEPIVIIEAPYQQFQLSDRESETKPVIQLVE